MHQHNLVVLIRYPYLILLATVNTDFFVMKEVMKKCLIKLKYALLTQMIYNIVVRSSSRRGWKY